MNTAQHARQILQAWKFRDRSGLQTALNRAVGSCAANQAISRLEFERQEMLEGIVEYLRTVEGRGELPDYSQGSAAVTLLVHLSLNARDGTSSDWTNDYFTAKMLNFDAKVPTCSLEVDYRPQV